MRFSLAATILAFITISQAAAFFCDDISKYSPEWFLSNTKQEWRSASIANALFYTEGLSARARAFAKRGAPEKNKVTIWEVWPCENYQIIGTRSNPLKCIMSNPETQYTYFKNMSKAFAMMSRGLAAVMHRNIDNPPMETIWGQVELPVLKKGDNPGGVVNWVTAFDVDANNVLRHRLEWTRMYGRVQGEVEATYQQIIRSWNDAEVSGGSKVFQRDEAPEGQACRLVGPQHPLY